MSNDIKTIVTNTSTHTHLISPTAVCTVIPGLLDFALRALALVFCDVSQGTVEGGEVWLANI